MSLGAFLLAHWQLWRKNAENHSPNTCGFREATTQVMVNTATGISSKLSVANCQNRYPSPSKRSDLSQVRPQLCFSGKPLFADYFVMTRKCLDRLTETRHYAHAKQFQMREGSKLCSKNHGLSGSLQWPALRLVWILIWNAALRGQRLVLLSQMRLAAMQRQVPLSAVLLVWFATTLTSVTNPERAGVSGQIKELKSAIGEYSPVVFCCFATLLPCNGNSDLRGWECLRKF